SHRRGGGESAAHGREGRDFRGRLSHQRSAAAPGGGIGLVSRSPHRHGFRGGGIGRARRDHHPRGGVCGDLLSWVFSYPGGAEPWLSRLSPRWSGFRFPTRSLRKFSVSWPRPPAATWSTRASSARPRASPSSPARCGEWKSSSAGMSPSPTKKQSSV